MMALQAQISKDFKAKAKELKLKVPKLPIGYVVIDGLSYNDRTYTKITYPNATEAKAERLALMGQTWREEWDLITPRI